MTDEFEQTSSTIDELESSSNVPWLYRWSKISHYYGDTVRQIFIAAASLMLLAAPFYTDDLSIELPFIVLGTVVIVGVAALTNPWKSSVISADAITAGTGLIIFEMWALLEYHSGTMLQFILREALAILFLFALYFSTKTLRSMLLHQVGKHDSRLDFRSRSSLPRNARERMMKEEERREMIHEINEQEKLDFQD